MKSILETEIEDVTVIQLEPHHDARGTVTEIFRKVWPSGIDPVQWNVVNSKANVLRGVHAHFRHADYLHVITGMAHFGLYDLRPNASTADISTLVTIRAEDHQVLVVPPGVAHGFYFPEPSTVCYSVTDYWDPDDELGCRWDDPALGIDWPGAQTPLISPRDDQLGTLDQLKTDLQALL